jgi:hypothetical protein
VITEALGAAMATEEAIAAHVSAHPPLDWLREVTRLRDSLTAAERDLERHERAAILTAAILVRKLGGRVRVTGAELVSEDGALVRIPEGDDDGYTLVVTSATGAAVGGAGERA